jgi:predicted metal-dependent HD superfamily phosphohydrolase
MGCPGTTAAGPSTAARPSKAVAAGQRGGCRVAISDADLAIFATAPDVYARYVTDVRAEYPHVPADAWRRGRGDVLRHHLDKDRIYRTSAFAAREAAARTNLSVELARRHDPVTLAPG